MNFDDLLFPHDKVRNIQDKLVLKIDEAVKNGRNLIVHAPTGLGKTAAALGPALQYAVNNDKLVFFLTSRHTQHQIAIQTLADINKKFNKDFIAVSIIGKKGLCLQPGVSKLYNSEFNEYCKAIREDKKCEFYERLKKKEKLTTETKSAISELSKLQLVTTQQSLKTSEKYGVCPYEVSMLMSKKAKVIIGDYFYVFNPDISNIFFKKIDKELKDTIIIVDEAHNIPDRVKDLFSFRLSNQMIKRAVSEAKKFKYENITQALIDVGEILRKISAFSEDERYIKKQDFIELVNTVGDYQQLIDDLSFVGDAIREEQKQSYIGSIASFLESWLGADEGFTRIISKQRGLKEELIVLSYRCLDPSLSTKSIVNSSHSTIMMSGTLSPTYMYKELLGFEDVEEETYTSPFPEKNRLNIIIPKTSTKYELRNEKQFRDIADILAKIVNVVPGNTAVFFPSYYLRDVVYKEFNELSKKSIFIEHANLTKSEKHDLLERFKGYKDVGAVLLGAISGSFAEGIDLPGDLLKCVVVVGLPLTKPDLESKALIEYYDKKFKKGWDYGYLFPAFNKTLQSAGRCIRSETDRGVIVFLDERYCWSNYQRCFPASWSLKTTLLYENMIRNFLSEKTLKTLK